ncbi:hypothetical protein [Streptomyces sp. NPDC058305]|uniref:hypothetical protein n=1 Tax=Streptomyces sp. NPDC058305 TaxID=3346438 RepID=UPI0036E1AD3E
MIDISELRTTGYRAAHRLRAHHRVAPNLADHRALRDLASHTTSLASSPTSTSPPAISPGSAEATPSPS